MEISLSRSKTWPVNAVAVVQLRVDSNGKAYSTFMGKVGLENRSEKGKLCGEQVELFAGRSRGKTIRTDTVSTILEQEFETDTDTQNEPDKFVLEENTDKLHQCYETFHVLALSKSHDKSSEETRPKIRRQASSNFDNWDLIFTESPKPKCPIHGESSALNSCPCKTKGPPCLEHTDCMLPELPLDARKVTTLRRHYYPESGWGWVIVACSILIHVLNHGVQLSCSQLVLPASAKFKTRPVHVAGKWLLMYFDVFLSCRLLQKGR